MLGTGTYGTVYDATVIATGHRVAIKSQVITDDQDLRRRHLIMITREFETLSKMTRFRNNHFTVQLLDAFVNEEANEDPSKLTTVFFVMEKVYTSLFTLLNSPVSLGLDQAKVIIYNLSLSLQYLHSANVMHRDLKPSNILLSENCSVKLCDFGMARGLDKTTDESDKRIRPLTPRCQSKYYKSPEVMNDQDYDCKADMWSFGCIVAEIMSKVADSSKDVRDFVFMNKHFQKQLKTAFTLSLQEPKLQKFDSDPHSKCSRCRPDEDLAQKVVAFKKACSDQQELIIERLQQLFPDAEKDIISLVEACLELDESRRLSAGQVIDHEFMKSVLRQKSKKRPSAPKDVKFKLDKMSVNPNCKCLLEFKQKSIQEYLVGKIINY